MNRKERDRIAIMRGIKSQALTQVQAAQLMGVGYRQVKRVWRRYQDEGEAGLVHRLRGRAGLRCQPPAVRVQVLARHAEERYADFGPTLLAEELAKEGIVADHDTVRRWLLAAGNHPWRRPLLRAGRAARVGLGASGRPSLRSGLPPAPSPTRAKKQPTATHKRGHSRVSS